MNCTCTQLSMHSTRLRVWHHEAPRFGLSGSFVMGSDSSMCLTAHVPLFLYPFLNTTSKTRPFEYLRLTSLGVIGALVKVRMLPLIGSPFICKRTNIPALL